ncbi:hypothetical protein [Sphaerisporangium dianthi]|uniref:Cell division protein ZipA n=1 Tax=Sphaerisporangium dianthi TaxID=1436120 RepID=A0ABV9CW57_9ACTN
MGGVNFVLAVWHEPKPITKERAKEVFTALGGEAATPAGPHPDTPAAAASHEAVAASVGPHPGVAAFAERLPETVPVSPAFALVIVDLERSDEVASAAFALARRCELVCYDPQRDLVHNLAPTGAYREMQLHTGDGLVITDPDLGLVSDVAATLSPENPFAALVVFGHHFVQVSPEPSGYELEYKDSLRNVLLRTHTADLEVVREAFAEYATGGRAFLDHHDWHRV